MIRKLGKAEGALAYSDEHFPLNLVGVLFFEGTLEPEILRNALNLLQHKHPFLRVRLTKHKSDYFFEEGEIGTIPLEIITRRAADHWQVIADDLVNTRIDRNRGPLCTAVYLKSIESNQKNELLLSFHHAIIDGASLTCLFDQLLTICSQLAAGKECGEVHSLAPVVPGEINYPPEFKGNALGLRFIPFFIRQMADEINYRIRTIRGRKSIIDETARGKIHTFRISPDITHALTRKLRKEGLTLNSALNAAMLMATDRFLCQNQDAVLRYMSMGSLRSYLKPPASPNELGCFVAMMRFTVDVNQNPDFWSLAHKINAQVYTAAKRGDKFITPLLSRAILGMTFTMRNFRLATTALSYTGPSRLHPSYGPVKIRGVRGFISNNGLGPELTAHVSLVNDELWWDMLYLDKDMDQVCAKRISDEIEMILMQASASTK